MSGCLLDKSGINRCFLEREVLLGLVLTMFRKSKLENQNWEIKIHKSKFDFKKNTASHINGKYSNRTAGSCLRSQYVKPLVALEKSKGFFC